MNIIIKTYQQIKWDESDDADDDDSTNISVYLCSSDACLILNFSSLAQNYFKYLFCCNKYFTNNNWDVVDLHIFGELSIDKPRS